MYLFDIKFMVSKVWIQKFQNNNEIQDTFSGFEILSRSRASHLIEAKYCSSMRSNNQKEALHILKNFGDVLAKNNEFILSCNKLIHQGLSKIEQLVAASGSALNIKML